MSSLGSIAILMNRVKPLPYERTRMSTLRIQLAVCRELRARLGVVWARGNPAESILRK